MTARLHNGWIVGMTGQTGADAAGWQLESAWPLAPWATVLVVLAAIGVTVLLYARESSGAGRAYRAALIGLRLAAIAVVLVMLAQWAIALRLTGPPPIALVIDRSASMDIADRYAPGELPAEVSERLVAAGLSEPTRLNLAKLLTTGDDGRLLRELTRRYRLELYLVASNVERAARTSDVASRLDTVRELAADVPESDATRLGDAVRRVVDDFRGAPPAAIVLLTDGVVTEGVPLAHAAEDARRKGVPLVAVGLGSATPPRDIELADVLVDDVVFAGDAVNFQAQIKASGLEGEQATITLRREDDAAPLAEEQVTLPAAGETLSVRLLDRPTAVGDVTYVVEVEPRDDEINPENNHQRRVVKVHDTKIRVLLVHGYPSYEYRFLKMLLERDPAIELATYLQDADPEHAEQDKSALRSFPVGRDELFEYDVLVIGDVNPRLLPRSVWQHVRAFVSEKGGGAAFLAGPRYLPTLYYENADVTALLPIEPSAIAVARDQQLPKEVTRGFAVRPTVLGLQNPALQLADTPARTEQVWRELAPLYWQFPVSDLKPAAQVLAQSTIHNPHSPSPLICFHYVGAGRVLFHAFDSTWRWRVGGNDAYFARYWVQTIRFLARGKLAGDGGVQLTSDRREYHRGELVELRARFLDSRQAPAGGEVTVLVEAPGQTRRRVRLHRNPTVDGVFEGSVADLAVGQYEAVLADTAARGDAASPPAARFSVAAPPGEFARLEMDAAALASAAEATGGKFYTMAEAHRLLDELPAGRRQTVENLPPVPLWNRWWMLTALLVCLTTEWILRKRKGML